METPESSSSSSNSKKFTKGRLDIKILVVGTSGTGKTSFCKRYITGEFSSEYKATVLSEYQHKIFNYNNYDYKIHLWDIAGQDKCIYTSKVFVKGAHGCLVMCDITQPETMTHSLKWKKAINENGLFVDGTPIPAIIVQNKIDLVKEEELENDDEIKNFAKENGFEDYTRISCKEGKGVEDCMDNFLRKIIDRVEEFNKKNNVDVDNRRYTSIVKEKHTPSTESLLKKRTCC